MAVWILTRMERLPLEQTRRRSRPSVVAALAIYECQGPISGSLCCGLLAPDNRTCLLTAIQLRLC